MTYRFLVIVLNEKCSFREMTSAIEKAFQSVLEIQDVKGRLMARGQHELYKIELQDKIDALFEEPDEYYVLHLIPDEKHFSSEEVIEKDVRGRFTDNGIQWISGIWGPVYVDKVRREIFPDKL